MKNQSKKTHGASIVTFANLGEKTNLPTLDILPVIDTFAKKNELHRVVCQINKNFYFRNTVQAVPTMIRYAIRVCEKITRLSFSRQRMEALIDFLSQYKTGTPAAVIFHDGRFLPRTLRRARRYGYITIDIPRLAHLRINTELEEEELRLMGIDGRKTFYGTLESISTHLNDFDYIIALSEFVKTTYVRTGYRAERIFIAPQDIQLERFSQKKYDQPVFRVIYVAFTTPLKGLGYLLEAWNKLGLSDAELLLVGEYSDVLQKELVEKYDSMVQSNKTIKKVGNLTQENLKELYQQVSVLAFPSITESLSRVTLEAMASGLPVITTENARGLVEDGKSGFVIPIRDAQALAEKILYLYDNRDAVERMGREARKAVENKKPFGEAVYEIYREILKREGKL